MNTPLLESTFDWLLSASLRATLIAAAVLCVQAALRHHLSAAWRYALWLPVVLVLVLPMLPERPWSFSMGAEPAAAQQIVVESVQQPAPEGAPSSPSALPAPPPYFPQMSWKKAALWTWLAGAAAGICLMIGGYLSAIVRGASRQLVSPEVQSLVDQETRLLRLRRSPRIRIIPGSLSPAVAGLLRPLLLLPAAFPQGFTSREAHLIIRHELMHIRRRDLPVNWLLCVLQCLHWFNPLLWFAFSRMRADRELACDAAVLAVEADRADHRADYGSALLKLQNSARTSLSSLALVGIFGRAGAIRGRIVRIARYRPSGPASHVMGVFLLGLLTLAGATRAQTPPPPSAPAAVMRPHVLLRSRLIAGPAALARNGEVIPDAVFQTLLRASSQKRGMDILSAPTITCKLNQRATCEVLREEPSPPAGREPRFLGLRIELDPRFADGAFTLSADATVSDQPLNNQPPETVDWSNVRMLKSSAAAALRHGQHLALDVGRSATGQHITAFIQAEAVHPDTRKAGDFTDTYPVKIVPAGQAAAGAPPIKILATLMEMDAADSPPIGFMDAIFPSSTAKEKAQDTPARAIPSDLRALAVSGVFTPDQYQVVMDKLGQKKKASFRTLEPAGPATGPLQAGEERLYPLGTDDAGPAMKILPAAGADGFTIDMNVSLPGTFGAQRTTPVNTAVTLWNGQTLMMSGLVNEAGGRSRHVAIFITAALDKPASSEAAVSPSSLVKKLNSIVFPRVQFQGATLAGAVEFLKVKSRDLDTGEPDPDRRGVNILLKPDPASRSLISMDLKDVPLMEVLRYVTELAGAKFTIKSYAVVIEVVDPNAPAK